ncbi:MAG: histidinol-phosphate transaminase [Actinomycetota bacterium]|nr:histidinol-phosphate transaminase [Actinomycetota bacterium]
MPTFREDLQSITPYRPGKPIEEVAREYGLERVVKLASNESPLPPFPEVQEAIARHAGQLNRYPDNQRYYLRQAVAGHHGIPEQHLLFGAGTTELLLTIALAVGGPGTSAVYAWPSFIMYPIVTKLAGAGSIEVALDERLRHDLEAMAAGVRPHTTIVYVCNPNNPTGTYVPADDLFEFIDRLPGRLLVVVDEAYFEYAQAADYGSALPLALERDNVLVTRTFSKVYGLAGLRVGYLVGHPDTLDQLRRAQIPFSVSSIAQVAAMESLKYPVRVAERIQRNAEGLKLLSDELAERGIPFVESQTNFVYLKAGGDSQRAHQACLGKGAIIRPMAEGWCRVSVGTEVENRAFLEALDEVRPEL